METELCDVSTRPDRFATSDEIRSALSFLPHVFFKDDSDDGWEIASDLGGYVRIELEGEQPILVGQEIDEAN